ncbi:MAG: SPOR domain-containing protein [Methylotenera sp.]|jgi:DedD protein|uniref:SPOR domain-containing protein n=1 Tax=Methylotenera sp. TaxID=2051956 RepID=UPI0027162993|nr:SPOR domain-containing protein [Methylotenera sp.]MDO9150728.1 SPOR domain-containing protein [Methylotenera sp.]
MSVDLPVDQALILKKRARRRLVGAVALVLLMLIILPQILQDRSAQTKPESIKITMPEVAHELAYAQNVPQPSASLEVDQQATENEYVVESELLNTPSVDSLAALKEAEAKEIERRKSLAKAAEAKTEAVVMPKAEVKKADPVKVVKSAEETQVEATSTPVKSVENQTPSKSEGNFTVQVGVYSDAANVKRLQDQLKQAGFTTTTEKATTPKGDGLRLKAGKFTSRQDAMSALVKIKEIGLPGIVISND